MVKSCVAAGCVKTSNDGISFFKFPVMRQRWTREVQRTRDRWSGLSERIVLCACQDCFEPDSATAVTVGLTKRQRLKCNAIPTYSSDRHQVPAVTCMFIEKRSAATTTTVATQIGGSVHVRKAKQAYEKSERDLG